MQKGFSLVELSIVLVILGLLVGGVLSGQSLIHAAQLRSVTTEHDKYFTAVRTFRDKYFAIPGDMTNATAFWGKDNTNCPGNTGTASATGVCNGDGDGVLILSPPEVTQVWRHLAAAGLIEGTYTGVFPTSAPWTVPGVTHPASKLGAAAEWGYYDWAPVGGGTPVLSFLIGADGGSGAHQYFNVTPVLTPVDAWNVDTKVDDGMPSSGKVGTNDFGTGCIVYATPQVYQFSWPGLSCYLEFNDQ